MIDRSSGAAVKICFRHCLLLRELIRRFIDPLSAKVELIDQDLATSVRSVAHEDVSVVQHGAIGINPRHLVYWICVTTDAEKQRLEKDTALKTRMPSMLAVRDYPQDAHKFVHIRFESQETVDHESGGS